MPEKIKYSDQPKKVCLGCGREKKLLDFYATFNTEKYKDGYLPKCKTCTTLLVDNWDPSTYLWILQEIDVPYVPDVWNTALQRYGKNPDKVNGTTILGRYLSSMRLKAWKDYRWKDTEFLQDLQKKKIEDAMRLNGYSQAEIAETVEKHIVAIPDHPLEPPPPPIDLPTAAPAQPAEPVKEESQYDYFSALEDDFDSSLTDEEKVRLRLKWGKAYKPEEWIKLETLYNNMMDSYEIDQAGHIDTLILICKASLKANQLIDLGDIEGFQKTTRVYDSLMKSGNFTAVQNRATKEDVIDSVGEIVKMCEQVGYIERYYTSGPMDKVDETIQDMQQFTKNLIEKETNFNQLVEEAIRKNMREDASEEEEDEEAEITEYEDMLDNFSNDEEDDE